MNQLVLDIEPTHKKAKPDSLTYTEVKQSMANKYNYQNILIMDRGASRIVRNRGYFSLDYWNYKDVIRWYPSGVIKINLGGHRVSTLRNSWRNPLKPASNTGYHVPWSVHSRLTRYIPWPMKFYAYSYHTMVSVEDMEGREIPNQMVIAPNGAIVSELGETEGDLYNHYKKEWASRARPRRRGQYWTRRARNLHRKRCGKLRGKCIFYKTWPRPTAPMKLECGCEWYRKNMKFRYSAQDIMKEKNATVRTSMIKIYGVAKFFDDIGARCIAKAREYQLLSMEFGRARTNRPLTDRDKRQQKIHALKMTCPSTGQVYVNMVPNTIVGVEEALNWMFNTTHYFSRVGKET